MDEKDNTTFSPGTVIDDKWVILEPVGKGGMGEVYLAHQLNLNRRVAIKVISREWINSLREEGETTYSPLERFRREVQIMARVQHPNVLQIQDHGALSLPECEGAEIEYIVMEYAPGGSLRSTMSDEGFYPDEERAGKWLLQYFLPTAEGVKALHAAGIIHRDLKPENVLLCESIPKIADFGLARSLHLKPITQLIGMQGTPNYMSPEHFLDLKRTDERTDIYALGKILCEAISGRTDPERVPFRKAALAETGTPFFEGLNRIIQNATEERREDRFPTVQAFTDALNDIVSNTGSEVLAIPSDLRVGRRSPWKPLLVTAALVLTASAATGFGTFVYEKSHQPPAVTAPSSPQVTLSQPEESTGSGEHSSNADYGPAVSHVSEIPAPQQFPPAELAPNPIGEKSPHIEAAGGAPLPKAKSVQSRQRNSKSLAGRQVKKSPAVAKSKSHLRQVAKDSTRKSNPGSSRPVMPEEKFSAQPPQHLDAPESSSPAQSSKSFSGFPWHFQPVPGGSGNSGTGGGC